MTKKFVWLTTLVPLLALQSVPASACKIIGYKNGEPLCATTSDASGYNQRMVGRYRHGVHFYPRLWKPGQPSSSNVTPAKGQSCGSGWKLGKDGTCYPNI